MKLIPDEGYYFGLGVFETIAVEDGKPILFDLHMQRLKEGIEFFDLSISMKDLKEKVKEFLKNPEIKNGHKVLKIAVSMENQILTCRDNLYREEQYEKGFITGLSKVRRNETSPLTYHKTLNYGDNLMEKRKAKKYGVDEPLFLNTKGYLSEGATTNLFAVKNGEIYTPKKEDGILDGVIRQYLCSRYKIKEVHILPEEIELFDEMFLTNSLLGIMPVTSFGTMEWKERTVSDRLRRDYKQMMKESMEG